MRNSVGPRGLSRKQSDGQADDGAGRRAPRGTKTTWAGSEKAPGRLIGSGPHRVNVVVRRPPPLHCPPIR